MPPSSHSRHRSDRQPMKVAGWVVLSILTMIAIVAIAVGLTVAHKSVKDNRTAVAVQDCSAGYLNIDIWAPKNVQDSLIVLITDYQANLPSDGGLCASFSVSAQSSPQVTQQLLLPSPYIPGVWIGKKSDLQQVADKHPSFVVTKPKPLSGTEWYIVSLDIAQNDAKTLDTTTAAHTSEATQAAVDVDTHIQSHKLRESA